MGLVFFCSRFGKFLCLGKIWSFIVLELELTRFGLRLMGYINKIILFLCLR
jgi:hypothetical protein